MSPFAEIKHMNAVMRKHAVFLYFYVGFFCFWYMTKGPDKLDVTLVAVRILMSSLLSKFKLSRSYLT